MEHIQTHHELSWQPCQGLYKSQTSGTTWGRKTPRGLQKERGEAEPWWPPARTQRA